jgi:hypothetical protein
VCRTICQPTTICLTVLGVLVGPFGFPAIWANLISGPVGIIPSFCEFSTQSERPVRIAAHVSCTMLFIAASRRPGGLLD